MHRLPCAAIVVVSLCAAALPEGPPPRTEPVREAGRTVFLPHAGAPFDAAKGNGLWCATLQMAWDALGREVLKGAPDLGPPAAADLAAGMNARPFPLEALDPAARVVAAGRKGDGVLERIAKEGMEKFGRKLPEMEIALARPDDVLAYAFLLKDLPFEHPFETIRGGVVFPGAKGNVGAFGVNADSKSKELESILDQVRVLFDTGTGHGREFAIGIRPKGGKDLLTLAVVKPGASLEETWKRMAALSSKSTPGALEPGRDLQVPKIHFDLLHSFEEFAGAPVRNEGFKDYVVTRAVQSVLFRLDEAGVLLKSEAAVLLEKGEPPPGYVFDRPFLVALRQEAADRPYLLLWIANPDLFPK
jgi:hypothetical protein